MADLTTSSDVDTMLASADNAAIRSNIGLGTAATLNVGTGASEVVQLTAASKLPAVDGSLLTNLPAVAISDPHIYYVRSNGNDSTGNGTLTTPYLTGTKAYDVGVVAAVPFSIDFGVGSFSITITANFSTYCAAINGAGYATGSTDSPTRVFIDASGASHTNANGDDGHDVNIIINNLFLEVDAHGGNVTVDDTNAYTGGEGGYAQIRGVGLFTANTSGGGDSGSSAGNVTGGYGGYVSLSGCLILGAGASINTVGGVGYGASNGADGELFSDGCTIRGTVTIGSGASTLGRTSYTTGFSITNDKGGNAAW
jgi:hypothetical protein